MSREIYQKIGLILALIITGVSLPTAVISLTREPTIKDYGNNKTEPDYSKPLERAEYYK